MDNTCQTCGNDLNYGDCGNCMVYCTTCEYSLAIDGEYINKDFNDEWIRNMDEYFNKERERNNN